MGQKGRLYYDIILIESLILAVMCTVSILCLWFDEVAANYDLLKRMIRAALVISIFLIPLESVLYRSARKRDPQCGLSQQSHYIRAIFPKLIYVFAGYYMVHYMVFLFVQQRLHLKQADDIYMFYLRLGGRITVMSLIGIEIADHMVMNGKRH